jgi:hypothetical protein
MSKTPFEIRLDLLNLAQSILSDSVWAQRAPLENDWSFAKENKQSTLPFPKIPSATAEEIIETARKLNTFIGEKE